MADKTRIACNIYMRAALPLLDVMIEEKPALKKKLQGWSGVVQFEVKNDEEIAAHIIVDNGSLSVVTGRHERPLINFIFKNPAQMKAFFSGGLALPKIQGLWNVGKLLKVVPLLLSLMLLQPKNDPSAPKEKALKVKLLLFLVPPALRELLRGGDEEAVTVCGHMPPRIFQLEVDNGPAAYFIVKDGKIKAGRGIFERRRPFITMKFKNMESAYNLLTTKVEFTEAIKAGDVEMLGPADYYKQIGNLMLRVNNIVN